MAHWTRELQEKVERCEQQTEEERKIWQNLCRCINKILESELSETDKLSGIRDLVDSLTQGQTMNAIRFMSSLIGATTTEFLEQHTNTILQK